MDSTRDSIQCKVSLVDVSPLASGDTAPPQDLRQNERCLAPPQEHHAVPPPLCTASITPLISLASSANGASPFATANATLLTSSRLELAKTHRMAESASSMPSSCGATTETETRFGDIQSHVVAPVWKSSSCLLSSHPCATATGGPRRLTSHNSSSTDGTLVQSRKVERMRGLSLRFSTTSPHTLHPSASSLTPREEATQFGERVSQAASSRATSSTPLLCCGLSQSHASEQERRASSAETFLAMVPLLNDDMTASSSKPLLPTAVLPTVVPCAVPLRSNDAGEAQGVASPPVLPSESPTDLATGAATRCTPQRRSRSFDMPFTFTTSMSGGSCGDLSRCYAKQRELSTVPTGALSSEQVTELHGNRRRLPSFMCSPESAGALSALRTQVVTVANPATAHCHSTNGGGTTATFSCNTSTNDGEAETLPRVGPELRRTISCDTLASISSSRSRPVLTPAAHGPPGVLGAASGAASTTTRSVTYTRQNVCLGALDFYGNPVMSLSSLLVQMSLQSGDHEEPDPPEMGVGVVSPYPLTQQQQQQRNTLSMQNLMVHTQQVGQMAPEDKVKRLHAKPDGGGLGMHRATGIAIPHRRRACTKAGSTTATVSTSTSPLTTSTAAPAAKPQVGSLKDVLQECNFLSLKDVLSAIADTHVHELREAQQRLSCIPAGGSDVRDVDGISASTTTAPVMGNQLPPCVASVLSKADETAATCPCPFGCIPPSAACRLGGTGSEWTCTSTAREGDCGACLSTSASTDTACVPVLHPSVSSMDPQQVLTLAAAITEVSLNLDRSTEASFADSITVAASSPPPLSVASRTRLTGRRSAPTGGCSVGDRISSADFSASFPTLLGETVTAGVAVSPPSIATPSRPRSAVSVGSGLSTAIADASHRVCAASGAFPTTAASAAGIDDVPETPDYRFDPLERKVLLCQSSEDVDDGVKGGMWECPVDRTMHTPLSPPLKTTAVVSFVTAASADETRFSTAALTLAHQHGGRYVANWHGLSSGEEVPVRAATLCSATVADAMPHSTRPPVLQQHMEPRMSTDCGACGTSCVGKLEHDGDPTGSVRGASSEKASVTAGGSLASFGDIRVVIASIACLSFDDELSTVSQLRQWAQSVSPLVHLQPSTDTEVVT
ncbi:hypothetical protein LPMP_220330 [Leishmania panamensis]|uniref:Uncharacterized protein n=1 Tax=Leishmania panamensis TaxID=5679 RepID=A0A088RQD9_LEIPA|nr:hypothetical protein LPMP_220330 [Leishmania panamensis]AIN98327.1 hypothetical protein LPMP_220330 [Leishmania panamensis]